MLSNVLYIFVFCTVIQGTRAQNNTNVYYTCDYISSFSDCNRFITDSFCGTDRVTYVNKCEFTKAHCADPTLNLLHMGDCNSVDVVTVSPINGGDVVFDFFCTTLSKEDCDTNVNKVCGTDGRTYINYCEYEKARCTHRGLSIAQFGDCGI